jgi:hypothetical protein
MKEKEMPEMLLHFAWQNKQFDFRSLVSTSGAPIILQHTGQAHLNAGPDFQNARITIDNTQWAGNVEIHVRSSEWYAHGHQFDPAYDSVILHVVWVEDRIVYRSGGERIPCLELKGRVSKEMVRQYYAWQRSRRWIPCAGRFSEVPSLETGLWLDHLLVERLQVRVAFLGERLEQLRGDWERLFYEQIFYGFGLRVNAAPMEILAKSFPNHLTSKYRDRPVLLEALLFGQAGLLPMAPQSTYVETLLSTYNSLRKIHQLNPLERGSWKFSRMRPVGFPTLRIARLAALIRDRATWFRTVLDAQSVAAIREFLDVPLSDYWQRHYRFGPAVEHPVGAIGDELLRIILVNVVIPFQFFYGSRMGAPKYIHKALQWMEDLPAENNRIIRNWRKEGLEIHSAGQAQAALQWHKNYCQKKRCLECRVGQQLLGKAGGRFLPEGEESGQ